MTLLIRKPSPTPGPCCSWLLRALERSSSPHKWRTLPCQAPGTYAEATRLPPRARNAEREGHGVYTVRYSLWACEYVRAYEHAPEVVTGLWSGQVSSDGLSSRGASTTRRALPFTNAAVAWVGMDPPQRGGAPEPPTAKHVRAGEAATMTGPAVPQPRHP